MIIFIFGITILTHTRANNFEYIKCFQVEVQVHKEEPIPEGWAYGPDGKPTTDAQLVINYLLIF